MVNCAAVVLVARCGAVFCDCAAVVCGSAAPEPDVLQGVFPRAQSGALCDEPVSAPGTLLVLHHRSFAGADAVDSDCAASACGWGADIGGGVAAAALGPGKASAEAAGRCVP